jgi:hypothetical protein
MEQEKQLRERELLQAITTGEHAEFVLEIVKPILDNFTNRIVIKLCNTNPSELTDSDRLAYHSELKVVSDLSRCIKDLVDKGINAKKSIIDSTNKSDTKATGKQYKF